MGELIFNTMGELYGNDITKDVTNFLDVILKGLLTIFQNETISDLVNITLGAAGALLILYFFMDLASKASIDMITVDKIFMACIRLFLGVAVLIYLPNILVYLFKFAHAMYTTMEEANFSLDFGTSGSLGSKFYFGYNEWPEWSDVQGDFEKIFKSSVAGIAKSIPFVLKLLIPYVLLFLAKIAAFFIAVSNALMLIMQAIYSPIAVANIFDGGAKPEAIRYLKKFLATAITFSIIIVALKASQVLGSAIMYNTLNDLGIKKLELTEEGISNATNMGLMVKLCVVRISAIGAMFGGSQLASAIVGSHDGH